MPALSVRALAAALPGKHAVVRYRWELWLLFGIPGITGVIRQLAFVPAWELLACADGTCAYSIAVMSGNVVGVLLLVISYRAVRRQGREFLALLWMLEIVTGILGLVVNGVNLAFGRETSISPVLFTIPLEVATSPTGSTNAGVGYPAISLAYLVVRLWFSRRASRISASHAFLIIALSFADSTFAVHPYVPYALTWYVGATGLVYLATQVVLNVVMFWALVRFDASSIYARWLIMATVLGGIFLLRIAWRVSLLASVGFFNFDNPRYQDLQLSVLVSAVWLGLFVVVPLALVWFVRVPGPKRDGLAG